MSAEERAQAEYATRDQEIIAALTRERDQLRAVIEENARACDGIPEMVELARLVMLPDAEIVAKLLETIATLATDLRAEVPTP